MFRGILHAISNENSPTCRNPCVVRKPHFSTLCPLSFVLCPWPADAERYAEACARARVPRPDGRRRRASGGLKQRTPLRGRGERGSFRAAAAKTAGNVSPTPAEVLAVAVEVDADDLPHRAPPLRNAAPSELLFMLERYVAENPPLQLRLDVMRTCIVAAYPDVVANDARFQSAMRWFRQREAMKPGDESSGGVLSDASKRSAALSRARLHAEVENGKQKVAAASETKQACEVRAYGNAAVAAAAGTEATCALDIVVTRRCRAHLCVPPTPYSSYHVPRRRGGGSANALASSSEPIYP